MDCLSSRSGLCLGITVVMKKVDPDLFEEDLDFPTPLTEEIPGNHLALVQIVAGQRALRQLYRLLEASTQGESRLLVRLLKRDWENRFGALLGAGEDLIREVGPVDKEQALPPVEQVKRVASAWSKLEPSSLVHAISIFSSKVLICIQMVPWVSDVQEVFHHFKECLEAEDSHAGVLLLLEELS